ncbi:unnamed protein product [Acanthoscelides obtectus]|uniref:Uncharacterized protein n=1 Tax=Acanthoscelides obtectus TaxID=200917 RepID=A0A9P0L7L2_ACAOB|nr:unnamed protein product [Acanthoscelides obtectus]CAK1678018.1 hypothetical protein AOBTE_LOCUS31717 [Acanthoscelides obtectus]
MEGAALRPQRLLQTSSRLLLWRRSVRVEVLQADIQVTRCCPNWDIRLTIQRRRQLQPPRLLIIPHLQIHLWLTCG